MKYSQREAENVLRIFQNCLKQNITIKKYHTEEFFHVFEISPVLIDGHFRNKVKFTDKLVDDYRNPNENLNDVASLIHNCFYGC